ncbi:MAG: hypothetical protein ACOZAK_01465 [Patescibacteria group bacterium]
MKALKQASFKTLFVAYAWLLATTGAILLSIASFHFYSLLQKEQSAVVAQAKNDLQPSLSSAGNPAVKGVETVIETDDSRAAIIANFLERHKSPMVPYDYYGQKLVEIADRYNLDFRLLPAISMQESNLCRNTHSEAPHNCLGFGIHERGTLDFESYEAGFERAGRELRAYYVDQGRITPEQIMKKYTPSSDGSWANSVNQWMAEMRYNDRELGKTLKEDANVLEFAMGEDAETSQ